MANVPSRIQELVETFGRNIEAYRSQHYRETQLRREFIDPFFEELGWDVTNKSGYAEAYKDVIHEDAIKVGGATKAPDYCFRIGGVRKFFLEAKKPSIDIKGDPHPAYQLRRYAWSAKLPLSILTDFEEFAVYDCQNRPKQTDSSSTARIMFLTYDDYLDNWHKIADIFSKDAVLKGSFDKFVVSPKGKRGTATVDREFLAEIEKWRAMLARIIALRNPSLSLQELNFAVQRTIDRILFLRMCEDRAIEDYGQLLRISSGDRNYPRLCEIFEKADQKYNSGLFHFTDEPGRPEPPDELTLNLLIDDKDLKWILYHLYYPQSPYEFSVLPAEILGNVYEQFLGKVISVSPARRVKIELKPEVKKAGGVYYTPGYIVDYIVKNTVAKLCEGKTPKQISKLKILDPARGSGSFLLGAYTSLLDYHRDWYTANDPESWLKKKNPPIYQVSSSPHAGAGGNPVLGHGEEPFDDAQGKLRDEAISNYRLTVTEKKRILLSNIFGVDIDSQAVEVTKLSLLLKVLEGENQQTLENQYRLFHERALPDLGNNIKCGNSLIGPDFFDKLDPTSITKELRQKINPFDWQTEFPEIFNRPNPGFDAVIGNPPYVFGRDWQALNITDDEKAYLKKTYQTSPYQLDMFSIFMEKAFHLSRDAGYVGQIVPNVWLTNTYSSKTRAFFLSHADQMCLGVPPSDVFPGITVDTVVYSFAKSPNPSASFQIESLSRDGTIANLASLQVIKYIDGRRPISTAVHPASADFAYRIKHAYPQLGDLTDITRGVHPYRTGGYGRTAFGSGPQTRRDVEKRPYHSSKRLSGFRPFIYGRDLARYGVIEPTDYVQYGPWLAEPRKPEFFEGERIYSRKILADRLVATLEVGDSVADQQVYVTRSKSPDLPARYILGILGSKLISFFIHSYFDEATRLFPQIKVAQLKMLPIRTIDFDNLDDVAKYDKMVTLVDRMLDLHKHLAAAKIPDEKTRIQREIDTTDRQIDNLVYDLYGLTEEEIRIVENT